MNIVYYVANGGIKELELVKETPRFYKVINSKGFAESMSKSGYMTISYGVRGKSHVTTDILDACSECKKQINKQAKNADNVALEVIRLKAELKLIISRTDKVWS